MKSPILTKIRFGSVTPIRVISPLLRNSNPGQQSQIAHKRRWLTSAHIGYINTCEIHIYHVYNESFVCNLHKSSYYINH
jgi:hypothetical protein